MSVRWKGCLSQWFCVRSDVRQGSSLPSIFNVFVNNFITRLRLFGWDCHINGVFVGCIMYADDLILLCPTVCGLQAMLNCCSDVSIEFLLTFNCGKSSCAAIGPGGLLPITEM